MMGGYWATVLARLTVENSDRETVGDCIAAIVRHSLDEYMIGNSKLGAELGALLTAAANRKDDFYAELDPVSRLAVWAQLNNLRKQKAKIAETAEMPAANLNTEKAGQNVG